MKEESMPYAISKAEIMILCVCRRCSLFAVVMRDSRRVVDVLLLMCDTVLLIR